LAGELGLCVRQHLMQFRLHDLLGVRVLMSSAAIGWTAGRDNTESMTDFSVPSRVILSFRNMASALRGTWSKLPAPLI